MNTIISNEISHRWFYFIAIKGETMKKYAILTSVLALTACATGGGSGGGSVHSEVMDYRTSNRNVVSMTTTDPADMQENVKKIVMSGETDTEYLNEIGTLLNDPATTARAAFSKETTGNLKYDNARELVDVAFWLAKNDTTEQEIIDLFNSQEQIDNKIVKGRTKIQAALKLLSGSNCFVGGNAQETAERILASRASFDLDELHRNTDILTLDNAHFIMSSASNGDEQGGLDIVKFKLNKDYKIVGVTSYALNSEEIGHLDTQDTSDDGYLKRQGDTNVFSVVQERDEEHGGQTVHKKLEGTTTIKTYGQDTGNKYSDFGQFFVDLKEYENGEFIGNYKSYEPFAGGYDEKKVAPDKDTTMTFVGKAVGTVQGIDDTKDELKLDAPATLKFTEGDQTLIMGFGENNWYDVEVYKAANDAPVNFKFTGEAKDENFALKDMGGGSKTVTIEKPGNYNGTGYDKQSDSKGKIEINYYGVNGAPEEFAGVAQYVESIPSKEGEVRVNMGFGGVKTNQPE